VRIKNVADMTRGETRVFCYQRSRSQEEGFLLCLGADYVAFANSCPHWNVDLDLGDERFYDERLDAVVCRNHGAVFDPKSGLCIHGPCRGAYLERFDVHREGLDALVRITRLLIRLP
jgi:nitrite reductase/ring-hydroxylating ferredoxin subunit